MRPIVFSVVTLSTINSCLSVRVAYLSLSSLLSVTRLARDGAVNGFQQHGSLSTPSVAAWALLGFALRDSAAARPSEGRRARGAARSRVRPPSPWRQRLRATPSGDECSRGTSQRDPPVGGAGRAAEGSTISL